MNIRICASLFLLFLGSAFAEEQKPIVVVLDWFINPNHAPLLVAEKEGFFKQQGIEVKFIPPADTSEGGKMVAAGKVDIAVIYQPALMYKIDSGLPLIRFATLINIPLSALTVLKNGPIHTIKDLKGKRIGSSTAGSRIGHMTLVTMLRTAGLGINDVEIIHAKFNLAVSLLTGKIDAFTGDMRNFEPTITESSGKAIKMFYPEDYGFPMYDELILVTNKNKINDPNLIKFIKALKQGVAYLKKNPQICWEKFAKDHPELDNAFNKKAWFWTLPYFASDPTKLDKTRYQKLADFMYQEKLITHVPNIDSYAQEL